MTDGRDNAPQCVRCGTRLDPALDGCLSCGQPGSWSADTSGEWALEIGPITSQEFRDQAVEQLLRLDPYLNRSQVAGQLRAGSVRVASNLTSAGAGALVEAFGSKETVARAVSGPSSGSQVNMVGLVGGIGGAAVIAVLALVLGLVGMLFLGFVGGVVVGLGLLALAVFVLIMGLRRSRVPQSTSDLLTLGVAPIVPLGTEGLVHRLHVASQTRGDDADLVLETGRAALRLLARFADPEDFPARIAGGVGSSQATMAAKAAREVVEIAERGGERLTATERNELQRLAAVVRDAERSLEDHDAGREVERDAITVHEETVEAAEARSNAG